MQLLSATGVAILKEEVLQLSSRRGTRAGGKVGRKMTRESSLEVLSPDWISALSLSSRSCTGKLPADSADASATASAAEEEDSMIRSDDEDAEASTTCASYFSAAGCVD